MITELEEAIAHAKELARIKRQEAEKYVVERKDKDTVVVMDRDLNDYTECISCAKELEQLAEWLEQLQAIKLLYKEYERFGGGFHYQVGRVFDGDYVLDNKESEDK